MNTHNKVIFDRTRVGVASLKENRYETRALSVRKRMEVPYHTSTLKSYLSLRSCSNLLLNTSTFKMTIQETLCDRRIIHSDPEIMSGVPVFVGTRVPLQTFFDYLEGEAGLAEFLEDFPHLQTQVLQALEVIVKAMLEQERTARVHSAG